MACPAEVTSELTQPNGAETARRQRTDWALIVAMDCEALGASPEMVSLANLATVSIGRGRGRERRVLPGDGQLRLDLPDRWTSQNHARLMRAGARWSIEDEGSRNGIRVNGERLDRKVLGDGDVIECGGTFLVIRRIDGYVLSVAPLRERPEALRTVSPAFDHELNVLRQVVRSRIPVLVLGETGTGKEGMAQVVHSLSGREGPLIAVNCGAIPATLVESELFGSRRGAFSGAEDRVGLLRSAERGTLFLDEIAELPMSSQAALLRVLQEKEIVPLGSTRAIPIDVRVVAATNRQIADFVEEQKLRRDLYARLSGYELRLPPLRARLEDLGLLIAALIGRHDQSGEPRTLSRAAARSLFAYSWPLNIRELEHCLAAAVAVTRSQIGLEHLSPAIADTGALPHGSSGGQRERLIASLERHGGNLSAVARSLSTSRSQLYRLLERHAIHRMK